MTYRKLLHLANHNSNNIGNGALILGLERVLSEDLGGEVKFIPEPWDDYTSVDLKRFNESFVDLVNGESDGLVVGSAVTLDGSPKFTNTGFRFDLPIEMWSRISKPIVFYAVSYRTWPKDTYPNLDALKRTMDYILANERILFSVRNDGTKAWLESLLGYPSEKIVAIPDPALYVPVTDSWHPELEEGKTNVLISLSHENETRRFDRGETGVLANRVLRHIPTRLLKTFPRLSEKKAGWQGTKMLFLKRLSVALERLSRDWDLNLILCPHSHEDNVILEEFVLCCPPRFKRQMFISSGYLRVPRARYFYDLYAKADVVLSMRSHSMVPAVGLGTPPVVLTSHPTMREFMKDIGLDDLALGIFDSDLTDKVYASITRSLRAGDEIRSRLQTVRAKMRECTAAYNKQVASLFTA